MKRRATAISLIELALILSLSAAGAYAFASSNLYSLLQGNIRPEYSFFAYFMPVILWGLLIFGLTTIIVGGLDAGGFIGLVALFSLPSILAHNSVNWFGVFGTEFGLTTSLSFQEALWLAALIVAGYVVLGQMRAFKQSRQRLLDRGADPADIGQVTLNSHLLFLSVAAVALALTAAVGLLSRSLESLTFGRLEHLPWNAILLGLASAVLLAAYLLWLGARRKPKGR